MKFLFFLFLFPALGWTQTDTTKVVEVPPDTTKMEIEGQLFDFPEVQAEFPGGQAAMYEWLAKEIRYPAIARESGIQGRVFVGFVIERNGELTDIKILRGIGGGCDEEALRAIKRMPRWKPGEVGGQKVRCYFRLPVVFKLT